MSAYAETANSFYISPRKIAASLLLAATILTLVSRCGGDDNANGPRSPLDTNGTRGSGYTPPGGWGGGYQPKGMSAPNNKGYTELPDEQHLSLDEGLNQRAAPQAIALPGDIMDTTSIVFSFTEEGTVLQSQTVPEATEI